MVEVVVVVVMDDDDGRGERAKWQKEKDKRGYWEKYG